MFTGLITGKGKVARIAQGSGESRFSFAPLFPVDNWVKGESIAVNGVCLSVETFDSRSFTAYTSQETLRLSTLGSLRQGDQVNLERALALGDRLGGHMVSGHADCIAEVESVRDVGQSKVFRVRFPAEFSAQVIPKGSVALDGVSLTVNSCGQGYLDVNVIPETQKTTTIGAWAAGRRINFETDMIGKYVESMIRAFSNAPETGRMTMDFLRDNGF